jgi:hypothetical protein
MRHYFLEHGHSYNFQYIYFILFTHMFLLFFLTKTAIVGAILIVNFVPSTHRAG